MVEVWSPASVNNIISNMKDTDKEVKSQILCPGQKQLEFACLICGLIYEAVINRESTLEYSKEIEQNMRLSVYRIHMNVGIKNTKSNLFHGQKEIESRTRIITMQKEKRKKNTGD